MIPLPFGLTGVDVVLILMLLIVFAFVVIKIFQYFLRMLLTSVLFGIFPFISVFLGMNIDLTLNNILWFMLLGATFFLTYGAINFALKVTKTVVTPFSKLFKRKKKEKIIIKEKVVSK
jgi:hypothetical protein